METSINYIFVRYGDFLVPLSQSTVETLIREKMDELWEAANLPEIPVIFLDEPPAHASNTIATFRHNEKKADRIVFYTSKLQGMSLEDMFDTASHEAAHYIQFASTGAADHSQTWKKICRDIVHCRPYAVKNIAAPCKLPDLSKKELIKSKQALLNGTVSDARELAIRELSDEDPA